MPSNGLYLHPTLRFPLRYELANILAAMGRQGIMLAGGDKYARSLGYQD